MLAYAAAWVCEYTYKDTYPHICVRACIYICAVHRYWLWSVLYHTCDLFVSFWPLMASCVFAQISKGLPVCTKTKHMQHTLTRQRRKKTSETHHDTRTHHQNTHSPQHASLLLSYLYDILLTCADEYDLDIYIYAHTHTHTTPLYVQYAYAHMYTHTHVPYTHTYVLIYVYTYTRACIHRYALIQMYMYTYSIRTLTFMMLHVEFQAHYVDICTSLPGLFTVVLFHNQQATI